MSTTAEMERTWTSVGSDHNGDDSKRARLAAIFDRLEWQELKPDTVEAMMPALGIRAAIEELRIPKVSHYAISNELAPYGLYAIRGHYKNGRADIFLCDEGSSMVVLASDFYPEGGAA